MESMPVEFGEIELDEDEPGQYMKPGDFSSSGVFGNMMIKSVKAFSHESSLSTQASENA